MMTEHSAHNIWNMFESTLLSWCCILWTLCLNKPSVMITSITNKITPFSVGASDKLYGFKQLLTAVHQVEVWCVGLQVAVSSVSRADQATSKTPATLWAHEPSLTRIIVTKWVLSNYLWESVRYFNKPVCPAVAMHSIVSCFLSDVDSILCYWHCVILG